MPWLLAITYRLGRMESAPQFELDGVDGLEEEGSLQVVEEEEEEEEQGSGDQQQQQGGGEQGSESEEGDAGSEGGSGSGRWDQLVTQAACPPTVHNAAARELAATALLIRTTATGGCR
jgi:hypothetical protein